MPVKPAASPEEIAAAAVYLASEDADYVRGTTLTIDGGRLAALGRAVGVSSSTATAKRSEARHDEWWL